MNEKMRVLELLENGKITADEAANLLEVLGRSTRLVSKEARDNMEEKVQKFAQDVSKFAKDCGCKAQVLYKEVEPKLKKASKTALEKAASALDSLANNISESIKKDECCNGSDDCSCDVKTEDDNTPKPN